MGNSPSSGFNNFGQQLEQGGYIFNQMADTIKGVGGSEFTKSITNLGSALKGNNESYNDILFPPTTQVLAQRQAVKTQAFNDNANATALSVGHVANSAYSGNMGSVTPPSQLQKISDPSTKMARAGAMGNKLNTINNAGKVNDIQAHPSIASAVGATDDVNPPSGNQNTGTPSSTPNGAETLAP